MKLIKTEDAVGHVLCHDITQIIKGVTKDAVFRKGHIVTEEDIPVLLSVGKENLYVWEKEEGMLHENDAAEILRQICQGEHMHPSDVKEGKIELIADIDGVLKIEREKLRKVNSLGEIMIASRHGDFPVKKGGTRVIPLVISEEKMQQAKDVTAGGVIFNILPYKKKKAGIVTTGSEVYYHRIKDTFTPVIEEKLAEYDIEIGGHEICNDDPQMIENAIRSLLADGCNMIVCTGGMSVDPDDRTPYAIRQVTGEIVSYGAPVLPGAMFLLAYYREEGKEVIPVLGLPGCVMYSKRTIFDLVLPRLTVGEILTAEDLNTLGEGGLCLNCPECTFPNCGFGKGGTR